MVTSFEENEMVLARTSGGKTTNTMVILREASLMERELSNSKERFMRESGQMVLKSRLTK